MEMMEQVQVLQVLLLFRMYTLEFLYFLQSSALSFNHLFIHGPILLVFRMIIAIIVDSLHHLFIKGRSSFISIRNDLPRSDTPVHLISRELKELCLCHALEEEPCSTRHRLAIVACGWMLLIQQPLHFLEPT